MPIPTLSTHSLSLSHSVHLHLSDVYTRNSSVFLSNRDPNPLLTREVIRSRHISSAQPDMARVTVRPSPQTRVGATYACTVIVQGRTNILSGAYNIVQMGSGSSTVTVTGE